MNLLEKKTDWEGVKSLLLFGNELFISFFLLIRAFFACFLFIKWAIVFFELFFDTPTHWHFSLLSGNTLTLISFKISKTFSSKFWLEALFEIPVISILFLYPYRSSELWLLSRANILLSRILTFCLRPSFLTCRFLIITSFKFNNSLSKLSNLKVIFFSQIYD